MARVQQPPAQGQLRENDRPSPTVLANRPPRARRHAHTDRSRFRFRGPTQCDGVQLSLHVDKDSRPECFVVAGLSHLIQKTRRLRLAAHGSAARTQPGCSPAPKAERLKRIANSRVMSFSLTRGLAQRFIRAFLQRRAVRPPPRLVFRRVLRNAVQLHRDAAGQPSLECPCATGFASARWRRVGVCGVV